MTDGTTDAADPKAAEQTPGYGDQGPAGAGRTPDAEDPAGQQATKGAIADGQDDAGERQLNPGGGSSSTGK